MFTEPILHVDMDAFFVEVERLRHPELAGIPVAVGGDGPRGVIAAASYESRTFGVRSAMPSVEARRRCPRLLILPSDHEEYGRVSEEVFSILRDVTPLVEGLSVDEAFLDVAGLRLHHPSPADVAVTIRRRIRAEIGLPASVGVAATKFVAKLASEAAKPDGLLHVPAEKTLDFLHPLPVRSLWGVGEATMAGLARLGIETVGDLAALPARVLERELGASLGAHLGRLANGDDPRPVVPDTDTKSVSAEHTFGTDLTTLPELVAEIRLLAGRVGRRLRGSGLVGRTVTVKLRYGDFTTITRSETMPEPTDLTHTVLEVARRLLEGAWEAGPVRLLGVGVSGLSGSGDPVQLTVDDDPRRRALETALDQVSERYGGAGVRPGSDLIRSKTRG